MPRKLGVKIQKAIEEPTVVSKVEEQVPVEPEAPSQAIRSFFSAPSAPGARPTAALAPASIAAPIAISKPKKIISLGSIRDEQPVVSVAASLGAATVPKTQSIDLTPFIETEFQPLAEAIQAEETKRSYKTPKPEAFVPQTSRGFSDFIRQTYGQFTLKAPPEEPDYDACMKLGASGADKAEMYQYQQFVRDYMTWDSPYRGLLVYHGLGSGKTCTAIAAAEALYGTSNRKVIIMTPASLRKNFLREISFCGFRHFRLQNHWVPYPNTPMDQPLVRLFASKVLNIPVSHLKKAKQIWIPDFTKPANYDSLTPSERTEVRDQIEAILVYDPLYKKKAKAIQKDGRFWFINYNGITASDLKELACQKPSSAFDNAVIIIDEIHNVIRLMQGTVEPYLSDLKGVKRRVAMEKIEPGPWNPKLCGKSMNYKRGYLLYRLLTGAQNSKIIGLSGTPLINFPEELGILSNVLHGYLHVISGRVSKGKDLVADEQLQKRIRELATANPYVDFIETIINDQGVGFTMTFLPEGIQKTFEKKGVERLNPGEASMTFQERLEYTKADFTKNRIQVAWSIHSEPLLSPIGETFRETFIAEDGISIKNKIVLTKRLTGLISYYKGSRKDLMPQVTIDQVVRVPLSIYQQEVYSKIRLEEIEIEEKKEKPSEGGLGAGRQGDIWAELYEIKKQKNTSTYRVYSRQACNFTFPPGIVRPKPRDKEEVEDEIGQDVGDIPDAVPSAEDDDSITLEEDQEKAKEEADAEDEKTDQAEEVQFLQEQRIKLAEQGLAEGEIRVQLEKLQKERRDSKNPIVLPSAQDNDAATAAAEALTPEEKRCRALRLPGENYLQAIARAKQCLSTIGVRSLRPEGLKETSPKFLAILERMNASKGSSLIYSDFMTVEGIGIFTLVLEANEYDPIEIETSAQGMKFSARTEASLKLGPQAKRGRYIKFTGGEDDLVRRHSINIFNAKTSELPKPMADLLTEAGYTGNQQGELCRVFCITAAGAEGLSLKNVRTVHIMEPFWNDVRMAQVKGRAVRICSHMELAPEERNVEIFTYISVFGPEAQVAKEAPWRVAEQIAMRDSYSLDEAKKSGLPIPEGAQQYVLTTDERMWIISQRKKALIDNLTSVMKSAAVDCPLNYNENKDGTFQCSLFKNTGDFMYHPLINNDIERVREEFGEGVVMSEAQRMSLAAVTKAIPPPRKVKIKGEHYLFVSAAEGTKFDIFADDGTGKPTGKKVGEVDAEDGKPKAGTARFYKSKQ
jgi:hypothetical protein